MALAAARRRPRLPVALGVGIVSMFCGGALVAWALQQPTIGGMVAAGTGAMMVFVGGAWTRRALVPRRA